MRITTPVVSKTSSLIYIYMLPPLIKLIISLTLFFVLTATGFFIIQQQSFIQLEKVSQKRIELEREISKEAKSYGELLYLSKQTDLAKKSSDNFLKLLPPESKIDSLLANITKLGITQGLKFVYFRPQQPVTHNDYIAFPVQVAVVGTFHQIGHFLSGLANSKDSLIAVNEFDLHRSSGTQKTLNLNFIVTLYYSGKKELDKAV